MKYILRILLIFSIVTLPLFSESNLHLILYFDINKTLIASDKAGNKSTEDVINELLAEKYKARWDESLPEEITFEEYVYKILVPGSKNNQGLRSQAKFYLQHFIDYLQEQNHPLSRTVLQEYEKALTILNTSEGVIFPSFYSLVDYLDKKRISYSIILRSFGEEVFEVKNEINTVHNLFFKREGKFREEKLILEDESIADSWAIYNQLRRIENTAIHDDWNYWNAHNEAAERGKPFYIDREDDETLSIFFDDNIREDDSTKNIIAPLDAATGEAIPIQEFILSGQAVRVDTLEAILNPDYYIDRVEEAMHRHSQRAGSCCRSSSTGTGSPREFPSLQEKVW